MIILRMKQSVLYHHPSCESLAHNIIQKCHSGIVNGNIQWNKFPDMWPNLFIEDVKKNCAGRNIIFLGSLHSPQILFEQFAILFELPRYLSKSVTFILPYFPTGTMERVETEGTIATASTMARMISATPLSSKGPCQIIMFDIHALQERFYFRDSVIPRLESAMPLLLNKIEVCKMDNICITFPDDGAAKRFYSCFEKLYPVITCLKVREGNERIVKIKEGNANGKNCIIVDDLVMSGGTLIECAKILKINGARSVRAFVTHAVFPNNSWKRFVGNDLFDQFFISDSVPHAIDIGKHAPFEVLSLADLIVEILQSYDLVLE